MTDDELHAQLRAHVRGLHASAAAVELLINHRSWLRRPEFRKRFLFTGTDFDTCQVTTGIDWLMVVAALDGGELPCSGSETRILRIAASLGRGIPVDLREALAELDMNNTVLVTAAVTQATGH
jgi:hypothetical protein